MEPTKAAGNTPPLKGWRLAFLRWFKGDDAVISAVAEDDQQVDWVCLLPFAALHLSCLGVLWVGWSPVAVAVAVAAYWNHHYYPGAARQGFYWWEFDPTYYLLKVLSWIGLVRDLRPVPERVYDRAVSGP